jgi:hypothetical protein
MYIDDGLPRANFEADDSFDDDGDVDEGGYSGQENQPININTEKPFPKQFNSLGSAAPPTEGNTEKALDRKLRAFQDSTPPSLHEERTNINVDLVADLTNTQQIHLFHSKRLKNESSTS